MIVAEAVDPERSRRLERPSHGDASFASGETRQLVFAGCWSQGLDVTRQGPRHQTVSLLVGHQLSLCLTKPPGALHSEPLFRLSRRSLWHSISQSSSELHSMMYTELLSKAFPAWTSLQASASHVHLHAPTNGRSGLQHISTDLLQDPCTVVVSSDVVHAETFRPPEGRAEATCRSAETGLPATLTRSKSFGAEKSVMSRPVVFHISCHVSEKGWPIAGRSLLTISAAFSRDFLLPSPSDGFDGWSKVSTWLRGLSVVTLKGQRLFHRQVTQFCTLTRVGHTYFYVGLHKGGSGLLGRLGPPKPATGVQEPHRRKVINTPRAAVDLVRKLGVASHAKNEVLDEYLVELVGFGEGHGDGHPLVA